MEPLAFEYVTKCATCYIDIHLDGINYVPSILTFDPDECENVRDPRFSSSRRNKIIMSFIMSLLGIIGLSCELLHYL